MSDVLKCACDMDSHQGNNLTLAVIKITLVILGLWATSAALPLYKGVSRSLLKGCSTCDIYLFVSGSLEFYIKLDTLPGHKLDYEFSATDLDEVCISNASGLFSCKVTLNVPLLVTDSSRGTMKMFGHDVRSDPVSNHLFNKLERDGIINYEVVIAFCGGPCFAVAVELVNDPYYPGT